MTESFSRRQFGNLLAAAALGTTGLPAAAAAHRKKSMHLIKPRRLQPGDLVGIVAPGGHTSDGALAKAVANIESLGLRVRLGDNINYVYGNYGGTVAQRLEDLHGMFLDPEIKAVWAIRGGSGCISLLEHIDYQLIRANPKILIGYSDITALHLALLRHSGLVTFHGPVASSTFSEYSVSQLQNVLMTPHDSYTIAMSTDNAQKALEQPNYAIRTVHEGIATGRLIGGNLSLVAALAGTPYAADFHDAILYLEEVNEEPYRVDRMMTQLQLSQGFRHAAAVMLGIFENCEATDGESALTLDETVDQHLLPLTRPAVAGYSFGHIRNQFTIPVGLRARLDSGQQTLTLLEPAVI
ncbi:S66 peptidase family protein [Duganella sp. Dugasp56]|uniref:S66 peptidase family protein n=1 Tax=Duganella sp. Dugasp56 TaxID=3243046 RepID=UPI0039AEC750